MRLLFLLLAFASCASAQEYPARAIRIVVAFPAGGGSDLAARVVGAKLAERVGQPVVIENRVGANGGVGAEAVARAAPDGYTLVMGSNANITTNPHLMALSYDPMKDLAPVAMLTVNPLLLFVNPALLPVNTFQEFLAYAKAQGPKLHYASAGNGSPAHLCGELLKTVTGLEMVHVPYKGGPQGMHDVVGGRVGIMFAAAPTVLPQVRAGKVRGIAMTGAQRRSRPSPSPAFPSSTSSSGTRSSRPALRPPPFWRDCTPRSEPCSRSPTPESCCSSRAPSPRRWSPRRCASSCSPNTCAGGK